MVRTQFLENYPLFYEQMPFNIKSHLTTKRKRVNIKSAQKAKTNTSNKNKEVKMTKNKKTNIKDNAIRLIKVVAVAGFVSIAIYLGIPKLSLQDVLSLASLVSGFALAFTFIK